MNTKIKSLLADLDKAESERRYAVASIKEKLQVEYNRVFNDSRALEQAINNAQDASMFQFDRYGGIEAWFRWTGLSDFQDCKEYFETWLQDNYCMSVDWDNDCFLISQGVDNLIIQDDTRHDNGVWQSGKCVIAEREYKNDDGEIDEKKRNALIEAHMERTGYYPGVFRVDYHGNIFPVNTQEKS